jgi:hypothetical protein
MNLPRRHLAVGTGRPDRRRAADADARVADVEAQFAAVRAEHPEFEGATALIATPYEGTFVYGPEDVRGRFLSNLGFALPTDLAAVTTDEFGGSRSDEQAAGSARRSATMLRAVTSRPAGGRGRHVSVGAISSR